MHVSCGWCHGEVNSRFTVLHGECSTWFHKAHEATDESVVGCNVAFHLQVLDGGILHVGKQASGNILTRLVLDSQHMSLPVECALIGDVVRLTATNTQLTRMIG